MAKYAVLIYGDEAQWDAMSADAQKQLDAAHRAFSAALGSAILDGQELQPVSKSTTLRTNGSGRLSVTDGPFVETKEALGGYYLIEAASLDEVVAHAKNLSEVSAGHSWVEIREVVDHG
ncbi:MAG TPA: YciI family protein [Micromonosporaceae bacterium]